MAQTWYYIENGERKGPHELAEMQAMSEKGVFSDETLVWHDEMGGDWAKVADVPELSSPPPDPPPGSLQPPPLDGAAGLRRRASVTSPVDVAWSRMVEILFRPFDMGKWFALGLSAWLSTLGQGSSGGSGFSGGGGLPSGQDIEEAYAGTVAPFLSEHGQIVLWSAMGFGVVALLFSILILWLQSRGRFMLLDNVVNNRSEVKEPWGVFKEHAGSLFRWRLCYAGLCLLVGAMLVAGTVLTVVLPVVRAGSIVTVVPALIMVVMLWVCFGVVTGGIGRLLQDFVIPIMYRHDQTCIEAWWRLIPLVKANFWRFVLYCLFYVLLGWAAGIAVMLVVLVTCCTAACLLMIPFINAVSMLPVTVFFRCYSLAYFKQYGPEFEMIPE